MTFLLVLVWALTAFMGGLAVARFYKRSAAGASGGQSDTPVVFWVTFIVIFVSLAAFAYALSRSAGHTKGDLSVRSSQGQRMSRNEVALPPEATGGEVNRPMPAPITIRKESPIAPDETRGEVNYPTPPPIIERKEVPIKPEP